jgi:hypothetical protein
MVDKKQLESDIYRLKDQISLKKLFVNLNYDNTDNPVDKENWNEEQKNKIDLSRIICKLGDFRIFYIKNSKCSLKELKNIASKIISKYDGRAIICTQIIENENNWIISALSNNFSKKFKESRHFEFEIKSNQGVPKSILDFFQTIEVNNDNSIQILNKVSHALDNFALELHDELTVNVFEALRVLSEGIILNEENNFKLNEQTLEEIREDVFILLYRIIFILYAEDRGIFPTEHQIYQEKFSFKWIKHEWLLKPENQKKISEYDVQNRLWGFFRLIELGSEDLGYDSNEFFMRPYYGRLFDRKINSKLDKWKIKNQYILEAISQLTRTHDTKGNYFFLDYSALEIRHLGSIYEHLLEFHLKIEKNSVTGLPNVKDRKSSGSYYTPKNLIDFIVKKSIEPVISNIIEKNPEKEIQIEKILSLKILDPAMGSGHFLVGAVEYLAKQLCNIEFGEITEKNYVERKRDVVRRCIYGVDFNPLAVDLARLSLWLDTLSSDKPLSFLSAHLKTGNSLIGTNIQAIFEKQTTLFESEKGRIGFKKNLKKYLMFESLEDDSTSAVKMKLEEYAKMQAKGTLYYDLKFLLDSKISENFGIKVPNLGDYRAKVGENSLDFYSDESHGKMKQLSIEEKFFHWDLEFPEIFYDQNGNLKKESSRGFDIIISNPPWDIVEPNIDDFFGQFHNNKEEKKFSLLTKPKKNVIIKKLMKNSIIENKWKKYKERTDVLQNFFKISGLYKFQIPKTDMKKNKIKMNLYKFFVERYFQILKEGGVVGAILPSGLYSDLGTNGLRNYIFERNEIVSLYGFLNKKGIFNGIHRQFKFMTIICKKGGKTSLFKSGFYIEDVNESDIDKNSIDYDVNLTRTLSPDVLSIIEFKNDLEVEIFKKIAQFPMLGESIWKLDMQREFNTTDDAPHFNTNKKGIPVYEGKMINQFDHEFTTPRYWIEINKAQKLLLPREQTKISSILKKNKKDLSKIDMSIPSDNYRLVWRLTTNATNTRTIICTILPPNVVTVNSLNYVRPVFFDGTKYVKTLSYEELLYLCAMLNSFVIDFLMRRRIASAINVFHMKELRIPKLSQDDPSLQKLSKYAAQLICTTKEFDEMKNEIGVENTTLTDEKQNEILVKINVLSAKICNITKKELIYILSTFPAIDSKLKEKILFDFEN